MASGGIEHTPISRRDYLKLSGGILLGAQTIALIGCSGSSNQSYAGTWDCVIGNELLRLRLMENGTYTVSGVSDGEGTWEYLDGSIYIDGDKAFKVDRQGGETVLVSGMGWIFKRQK